MPRPDDDPKEDQQKPVSRVNDPKRQVNGTAGDFGLGDPERVSSPNNQGDIGDYINDADRKQNLAQFIPLRLADQVPFTEVIQDHDAQAAGQERQPKALRDPQNRQAHVSAQKIESPVGQINDPGQAKGYGKTAGQKKEEGAHGNAVQGLDYPIHEMLREQTTRNLMVS